MVFVPNTPESLLARSDSKDPSTTCKGITSAGRPCRRSLGAQKSPSRPSTSNSDGILAVVEIPGDGETAAAAFYCWQHKDQAQKLTQASPVTPRGKGGRRETKLVPVPERTSIDSLTDRLGILDIDESAADKPKKPRDARRHSRNDTRRIERPPTWTDVQGPVLAVPRNTIGELSEPFEHRRPAPLTSSSRRHRKQPSFWDSLFCMGSPDQDDEYEVVRRRKRTDTARPAEASSQHPTVTSPTSSAATQSPRRSIYQQTSGSSPGATVPVAQSTRRESETTQLLSLIPPTLSPQTTSALLAELSKPFSQHDDPGFIYIFWLTDLSSETPSPTAAASLLSSPQSDRHHGRRPSDVLSTLSDRNEVGNATILLKIGRANNVQRRMNEWTKQCNHNLSLVRFYPYVPSSPQASPANTPSRSPLSRQLSPEPAADSGVRKVPHVNRVERLIHIELAEKRVKKACDECGKEHREWFRVSASRDGVKEVDEVIKRWVSWAERASNS